MYWVAKEIRAPNTYNPKHRRTEVEKKLAAYKACCVEPWTTSAPVEPILGSARFWTTFGFPTFPNFFFCHIAQDGSTLLCDLEAELCVIIFAHWQTAPDSRAVGEPPVSWTESQPPILASNHQHPTTAFAQVLFSDFDEQKAVSGDTMRALFLFFILSFRGLVSGFPSSQKNQGFKWVCCFSFWLLKSRKELAALGTANPTQWAGGAAGLPGVLRFRHQARPGEEYLRASWPGAKKLGSRFKKGGRYPK